MKILAQVGIARDESLSVSTWYLGRTEGNETTNLLTKHNHTARGN
jgi:hypothetical protein